MFGILMSRPNFRAINVSEISAIAHLAVCDPYQQMLYLKAQVLMRTRYLNSDSRSGSAITVEKGRCDRVCKDGRAPLLRCEND